MAHQITRFNKMSKLELQQELESITTKINKLNKQREQTPSTPEQFIELASIPMEIERSNKELLIINNLLLGHDAKHKKKKKRSINIIKDKQAELIPEALDELESFFRRSVEALTILGEEYHQLMKKINKIECYDSRLLNYQEQQFTDAKFSRQYIDKMIKFIINKHLGKDVLEAYSHSFNHNFSVEKEIERIIGSQLSLMKFYASDIDDGRMSPHEQYMRFKRGD